MSKEVNISPNWFKQNKTYQRSSFVASILFSIDNLITGSIKKFIKTFYKYLYYSTPFAAILIFILTVFICSWIFGGATCRDGWSSPSIGNRGACSHHGGVRDNTGVYVLFGLFTSWGAVVAIGSNFRTKDGYVVLSKLPVHPFEKISTETRRPDFTRHYNPTQYAQSRAPFLCSACKKSFAAKTTYLYSLYPKNKSFYYSNSRNSSSRTKYCVPCGKNITEINARIALEEKKHIEDAQFRFISIMEYYEVNAIISNVYKPNLKRS